MASVFIHSCIPMLLLHSLLACVYVWKIIYAALPLRCFQFPSNDNNSDDEYVQWCHYSHDDDGGDGAEDDTEDDECCGATARF